MKDATWVRVGLIVTLLSVQQVGATEGDAHADTFSARQLCAYNPYVLSDLAVRFGIAFDLREPWYFWPRGCSPNMKWITDPSWSWGPAFVEVEGVFENSAESFHDLSFTICLADANATTAAKGSPDEIASNLLSLYPRAKHLRPSQPPCSLRWSQVDRGTSVTIVSEEPGVEYNLWYVRALVTPRRIIIAEFYCDAALLRKHTPTFEQVFQSIREIDRQD